MIHAALVALVCLASKPGQPSINMNDIPECGPSCVFDLLKTFGRSAPMVEIKAQFRRINPAIDFKRVTLLEVNRTLASYGLHTLALRFDPRGLSAGAIPTPSILHLDPPGGKDNPVWVGHYIVLHNIDESGATIYDPAPGQGMRTVDLPTLKGAWTGQLLYVSREPIAVPSEWGRLGLMLALVGQLALVGYLGRLRIKGRD